MRVTGDGKFKEWRKILIKIGNGTMVVDKDGNIKLPKKFSSSISSSAKDMQQDAIDFVYQSINENLNDSSYFLNRAILCPHNDSVKEINDTVTQLFSAEEMISYSSDSTIDKEEDVPIEFLNTLNLTGLPQHEIILKKNMPVMLMRNINKERGLCNGTRLIVKQLRRLVLELYNPKTKQNVCLPRFDLEADIKKCGVRWKRRQFPIQHAFAMTINKSQGQTLSGKVAVYLKKGIFSHGQLYVAASRVTDPSNILFIIPKMKGTKNIVLKCILDGEET